MQEQAADPATFQVKQLQCASIVNTLSPLRELEGAVSTADELAKLAQLRDSGVLTDAEFEAQKVLVLGVTPLSSAPTRVPRAIFSGALIRTRSLFKHWWAWVVAVVVLGAIGGGVAVAMSGSGSSLPNAGSGSNPFGGLSVIPTTTTTAPPSPAVGPVGSTATITEGGINAGTVTVSAVDISTQPGNPYSQAPQNGYYAIVHLSAQADPNYTGGFSINPADFYVLVNQNHYSDTDGYAWEALAPNQSLMSFANLGAGESTSGLVPFDISAAHGTVVFAPNANGQPVAEWTF